jgi:hypothetical protein
MFYYSFHLYFFFSNLITNGWRNTIHIKGRSVFTYESGIARSGPTYATPDR